MREYIFGHVQRGGAPLTGADLAAAICEVARSLPGFEAYCRHQSDLEPRALFYARSIQSSHYYPFGSKHQAKTAPLSESIAPPKPNWNQEQSQAARERIQSALIDSRQRRALPETTTARREAIKAYGIGNQTLDKYKELWHPNYLKPIQGEGYHPIGADPIHLESLEPLQREGYHPIKTNKLVPIAAAPQGQAVGFQVVGGSGGLSTGLPSAVSIPQSDRAEQQFAKVQGWLASGDPILVAEAQRFFTAQAQKESISLVSMDGVALEQRQGCANEEAGMPGGSGRSQPQRRGGKTALQEIRQLSIVPQQLVQEPDVDLAIQAEVEAFFAQSQQERPDELALAWFAGVCNPLERVDLLAVGVRFLQPEEEDWLALARLVGWLLVEDALDAIYFTAPPPVFALGTGGVVCAIGLDHVSGRAHAVASGGTAVSHD